MKDFLREVKYAYQRVRYGYDERIKWEFDSYFSQFIPPLKEFCNESKKQKVRKIKAWAVFLNFTGYPFEIQTSEYFAEVDCPSAFCPPTMAIFEKEGDAREAKRTCLNPKAQKVVPIEIIIHPTK